MGLWSYCTARHGARHYGRENTFVAITILLLLSLLAPATSPALAADAPGTATAPVVVDGVTLFRVRGLSAYPADERASVIADRVRGAAPRGRAHRPPRRSRPRHPRPRLSLPVIRPHALPVDAASCRTAPRLCPCPPCDNGGRRPDAPAQSRLPRDPRPRHPLRAQDRGARLHEPRAGNRHVSGVRARVGSAHVPDRPHRHHRARGGYRADVPARAGGTPLH